MELLDQIEAFIEQARISQSRFGRACAGDPRLVGDLKAGRRLRRATEQKIRDYLINHHEGTDSPSPSPTFDAS